MYHYEALGDDRFQEFCQALISASFPNAQCLPVGQPDGGRDAFLLHHLTVRKSVEGSSDTIVFQVKYAKNPSDRDEREMVESVIKTEGPKIDVLKKRGMTKYYLLTNVRGTAHLDVGSIDRVNKALSEAFGIEAYCWWRDDLDRRLDAQAGIKWSYPETLKATDLLEKLVAGQLGEDEERRRGALRAYMTSQYEEDQELKFKQTDLRSTMTELFVDLPMRFSPQSTGSTKYITVHRRLVARDARGWALREGFEYEEESYRAAQYFVEAKDSLRLSRVVLEGAPGQGKSTVTQFICQILRMQLLDKKAHQAALPLHFQRAHAKVPFRVDLRDLAKWLSGIDPFVSKPQALPELEPRSLEGFLAGHVRFLSGGHTFNVSDLTAVVKASHILLALDGFDEVADIAARQKLVDEITKGTNRLINAGGFSLQTIVTSRPAAFAKSVRFPPEQWAYYELLPLEGGQIEEYTTKWMKAKGLKDAQQSQLKVILDAKLKEAHTQFLAKNPMQLTILLSLVNSRGASLPDKRTAMYDAYMDMFFSRESEKSEIVRDNRDLLIDIHRYLAWKLQAGAEAGDNGSIEQGTLKAALFSYLDREGEDTAIVNSLFDGMIERVGALVSRVQGTYEFEVQPLREYFAARHLYETAPYPSDDQHISGDKFDRFRALVCNPYWLNVARFYGGCFNKGEILTLVNELIELSREEPFRKTSLPRSVSLMLLGDWVFNQYQPAVKQVVSFIGEYPHFRTLLANAEASGLGLWANLPERSGRMDFLNHLWERLKTTQLVDEQRAISNAIVQNATFDERAAKWEELSNIVERSTWARLGGLLGLVSSNNYIKNKIFEGEKLNEELVEALVTLRHFQPLHDAGLTGQAKAVILCSAFASPHRGRNQLSTPLDTVATITSFFQYQLAFVQEGDVPLDVVVHRRTAWELSEEFRQAQPQLSVDGLNDDEIKAVEAYKKFISEPVSTLASSQAPWSELVVALRGAWRDCPAIDRIALIAAGIRSKSELGEDIPLAQAQNLVASVRFMRLKSGAPKWWRSQLDSKLSSSNMRRTLLVLLVWGTSRTLFQLVDQLEHALDQLSDKDWRLLYRDFRTVHGTEPSGGDYISATEMLLLERRSSRLLTFIGLRASAQVRSKLATTISDADLPQNSPEAQFALQSILGENYEISKKGKTLERVSKLYLRGAAALSSERPAGMDEAVAERIIGEAETFPLLLVATADRVLSSAAGTKIPKLQEIAQVQHWFANGNQPLLD